jgi:hypothetical protein
MENGKWEMAKCSGFSIFHLPSGIQDAFSASPHLGPDHLAPRLAPNQPSGGQ